VSAIGTIYISGVPEEDEQIARFWAQKQDNAVPLHRIVTYFSPLVLAREWTEQLFNGSEGSKELKDWIEQFFVTHPELIRIKRASVIELISEFTMKPVFRKELEAIRANIVLKPTIGERIVRYMTEEEEEAQKQLGIGGRIVKYMTTDEEEKK